MDRDVDVASTDRPDRPDRPHDVTASEAFRLDRFQQAVNGFGCFLTAEPPRTSASRGQCDVDETDQTNSPQASESDRAHWTRREGQH